MNKVIYCFFLTLFFNSLYGQNFRAVLIKDINSLGSSNPDHLCEMNGQIYFSAQSEKGTGIWISDGTEAGTKPIFVREDIDFSNDDWVILDNNLYFFLHDRKHGTELWRSDGTKKGTYMVKDIYPKTKIQIWPAYLIKKEKIITMHGKLFFYANDAIHGKELWTSDGTKSGTYMLKDINPDQGSTNYGILGAIGNYMYFLGDDGKDSSGIWHTDGTREGTRLFLRFDFVEFQDGSSKKRLSPVMSGFTDDKKIYFIVRKYDKNSNKCGLWESDGSLQGSRVLKEWETNASSANVLYAYNEMIYVLEYIGLSQKFTLLTFNKEKNTLTQIVESKNDMDFYGNKNNFYFHKRGLYRTDGSQTVLLLNSLNTFNLSFMIDSSLVFMSGNSDYGNELWISDGTAQGTKILLDANPGHGNGINHQAFSPLFFKGELYITMDNGKTGFELYKLVKTIE